MVSLPVWNRILDEVTSGDLFQTKFVCYFAKNKEGELIANIRIRTCWCVAYVQMPMNENCDESEGYILFWQDLPWSLDGTSHSTEFG